MKAESQDAKIIPAHRKVTDQEDKIDFGAGLGINLPEVREEDFTSFTSMLLLTKSTDPPKVSKSVI